MLKLLSEFLRNPGEFFLDESRQRIISISLFGLLFVCILFSMARGATRRRNASGGLDASPTPLAPVPTQTKWWVRHEPSETPTSLTPSRQTLIGGTELLAVSSKCPAYAADFKPGTFAYISLFPPYENLVRSGAGKNYFPVGFIEIGGWVKILAEPVCADDGYVWLNVESAADSSNWTAGGHKTSQWVIPCPDPNKKCSKNKPTGSISATPNPNKNGISNGDGDNPNACASDKLAVGLDAQVSPNDLLVVRSEPFTGSILGRIAPLAVINIIDGPKCAGGAIWWKVWGPQTGWTVENNLRACPKERECGAWKDE
ncbi:MAG TPA: hypothetical protein VFR47_06680 [Anaerolineales bacterium]|nr:hypothetical protein [Anaerolineales bacterium]